MKLTFYISGHGYGHATRMIALMNELLRNRPMPEIEVRTAVPEWLFRSGIPAPFTYTPLSIDAGVVERDLYHQDIEATLKRSAEIMGNEEHITAAEVEHLKNFGTDLIISDIPPLASSIGHMSGKPVVAIGNFSWDFIYSSYVNVFSTYNSLVDRIRVLYQHTNLLLRLPFNHEMTAFPVQKDIPIIARLPEINRARVRHQLGIDDEEQRQVVFVALRQSQLVDNAMNDLLRNGKYKVVTVNQTSLKPDSGLVILNEAWTSRFVDVLHASDVVVSKLGYSIAAECIASRTPLIYPPRFDYPEHELLQHGIKDTLPSAEIPLKDFISGKWSKHIQSLLASGFHWRDIPIDGAAKAADIIRTMAQGGFTTLAP